MLSAEGKRPSSVLDVFLIWLEKIEAARSHLITEVHRLELPPATLEDFDAIKDPLAAKPVVFPATWSPSWNSILQSDTTPEGLDRLLGEIIEVEVFRLQFEGHPAPDRVSRFSSSPAAMQNAPSTQGPQSGRKAHARQDGQSSAPGSPQRQSFMPKKCTSFITPEECILRPSRSCTGQESCSYPGHEQKCKRTKLHPHDHPAPTTLGGPCLHLERLRDAQPAEVDLDGAASHLSLNGDSENMNLLLLPRSTTEDMLLGDCLKEMQRLSSGSRKQQLYLTWRNLPSPTELQNSGGPTSREFGTFIEDLVEPTICPEFVRKRAVRERNLWLGCSVTSQLHFDALDNLHVVVEGKKIFHLYSPWDTHCLYPTPWEQGSLNNTSRVRSVFCADEHEHPRFVHEAGCQRIEV